MTERLLLVSTCGTSLLTSGASDADRRWLTQVANDVDVDSVRLTSIVDDRRERLTTADESTRRSMSAELNGIGAVLERSAEHDQLAKDPVSARYVVAVKPPALLPILRRWVAAEEQGLPP